MRRRLDGVGMDSDVRKLAFHVTPGVDGKKKKRIPSREPRADDAVMSDRRAADVWSWPRPRGRRPAGHGDGAPPDLTMRRGRPPAGWDVLPCWGEEERPRARRDGKGRVCRGRVSGGKHTVPDCLWCAV